MNIYVSPGSQAHERAFLDAWVLTLGELGHTAVRRLHGHIDAAVVWNGRGWRQAVPTIYCELGWLPRWSYQVSWRGINADHHAAGLEGIPEGNGPAALEAVHAGNPRRWAYTERHPDIPLPSDVPERFWLLALQVESDTNMRHVPPELRTAQGLVDAVCNLPLDAPLCVKAHPAAKSRRPYAHGTLYLPLGFSLYDILATGRVRGVITLNSNTCNDALAYGVPAVVLGNGIWPTTTGAFYRTTIADFKLPDFLAWEQSQQRLDAAAKYMNQLDAIQWTPELARNQAAVREMLAEAIAQWQANPHPHADPGMTRELVNIVATDHGWLFEELKAKWQAQGSLACDVIATTEPLPDATAWTYFRPEEAANSPDPQRTVVQLHDLLWQQNKPPREREAWAARHKARIEAARQVTGWAFNHPQQIPYVAANRPGMPPAFVMLPLGASRKFFPRHKPNPSGLFRAAWVGRNGSMKGLEWLVQAWIMASKRIPGFTTMLLGEACDQAAHELKAAGVPCDYMHKADVGYDAYPQLYQSCDVVCVASQTESQPFPLFEALASGVPVCTTPVGWSPMLVHEGLSGHVVPHGDAQAMANAIKAIADNRDAYFALRKGIAAVGAQWTLEDWFEVQAQFALRVGRREL